MPTKKKPAKRAKPVKLSPDTEKAEPGESGPGTLWISQRQAGVRVDENTAMTLGAVFACVRVISEDIAGLPWRVRESKPGGGSDERSDDPADWLLHHQANTETPAFQFRETLIAHALTWGNGYAEIERDLAGRPAWLWQLTPDRVEVVRDGRGRIVYDVMNPGEPNTVLDSEDVYHLRGLGFDGLVGYSVLSMAARSIGLGLATEEGAGNLFANDSTPGGLLKHPQRLKKEAHDKLRETWQKTHGGPNNRRTVAILEEGMSWEQTGLPPQDAQLIEQRQFTPAEICRWFRVSPPKIADLLRATFSNIEELAIWHVTDTLTPWVRRLETEANIKLFGRTNRGKRFTKINLNALLRGNSAARGEYFKTLLDRGVYCPNDVLELEDRNPIGASGDKRFVPLNMQLLDDLGEEPPAPPPNAEPIDPEEVDPEEQEEEDEPLAVVLRPVVEDALARVLRREWNCVRKQTQKLTPEELTTWLADFRNQQDLYLREAMLPSVQALAGSEGIAKAAVAIFADLYAAELQGRLGTDSADSHAALAPSYAAKLIEQTLAARAAAKVGQ